VWRRNNQSLQDGHARNWEQAHKAHIPFVPYSGAAVSYPTHRHTNTCPTKPRAPVASAGHMKPGVTDVDGVREAVTARAATALTVNWPEQPVWLVAVTPFREPPGNDVPTAPPITKVTVKDDTGAALAAKAPAEQMSDVSTNAFVPIKVADVSKLRHVHVNVWPT